MLKEDNEVFLSIRKNIVHNDLEKITIISLYSFLATMGIQVGIPLRRDEEISIVFPQFICRS